MRNSKRIYRGVPAVVFILSLISYWLTAESGASYWDCPEYITGALLLEIGHPPGNPFWMLTHRVLSIFHGSLSGAFVINLCSGLFMALAVALGSAVALIMLRLLTPARTRGTVILNSIAAASGALIFAWCDSTWFSAVEAEVYAMSLFLTILTLYLAIRARLAFDLRRKSRLIILIAYLSGLSVGVHQLNLLVIPVVFLICRFGLRRTSFMKLILWFLLGCFSVVIMLKGLLHGTPWMASCFELVAVNRFGLTYHTGLLIWAFLTLFLCVATIICACRSKTAASAILFTVSLAISGITFISTDSKTGIILGILTAIAGGIALSLLLRKSTLQGSAFIWCLPLILIGFSCYSVIMIRAAAQPPMNQGNPSDIFAFANYLDRKQYGSRPLFYGRTPQSRPMRVETVSVNACGDTVFSYGKVARKIKAPVYHTQLPFAKMPRRTGLLSHADSLSNSRIIARNSPGYIITDHYYDLIYTPELNSLFPRIVDGDEKSMEAYAAWTGMTPATMQRVPVSVALDSLGKPLAFRHGENEPAMALRPTPLHHLNMFLGYQLGYMYFRYLLWNFAGRQNDIPSTGEAEHGNFITGIDSIDTLMLGNQAFLPDEIKGDNAGRNLLYFIPFLTGIAGIIILLRRGRKGRRIFLLTGLVFILTGPAIVFYLNQNLGEPRERDYSFLGSFYIFSLWITVALSALAGAISSKRARHARSTTHSSACCRVRRIFGVTLAVVLPVWMFIVNLDDHNRRGRTMTDDYARMILESCPSGSILFVYGDNHTFPLWYAQDVLAVRRDVIIVNLSYLGSDWYLSQLSAPRQDGGEPLRMVGTPADFAYGRYAVVRLGTDTTTVDALTALREMYSAPDSSEPMLRNLRLRFHDGTVYDIEQCLDRHPRGFLTAGQIALIDIVASAKAEGNRPVLWINNMGREHFNGLYDFTTDALFTRMLGDSTSCKPKLPQLRWGGADKGRYVDPTSGRMLAFIRRNLLRHAITLQKLGKDHEALALTDSILNGMPFSARQSDLIENSDTVADEETLLYQIRLQIAQSLGDDNLMADARKGIEKASTRRAQWQRYLLALSPADRALLSPTSRRKF